jgi:hypothetical protein
LARCSIEAPDEKSAIAKVAETFNIPPASPNKIVVIKGRGRAVRSVGSWSSSYYEG